MMIKNQQVSNQNICLNKMQKQMWIPKIFNLYSLIRVK